MLSEKLYLMQGDTLLATLYDGYSPEMFWLSYKYEAEEAFASVRPLFEKASYAIENDIDDEDETYRELFHMDVKLVDADSNEVFRHLLLHVNDDHIMLRPLYFPRQYILKKNETILAEFVDIEDNADRMWWFMGQFKPTTAFTEYKDLFFEASQLLQEHQNPERVQEIYAHLKSQNIELTSGNHVTATKYPNFTLRFAGDKIYICTFDNCD